MTGNKMSDPRWVGYVCYTATTPRRLRCSAATTILPGHFFDRFWISVANFTFPAANSAQQYPQLIEKSGDEFVQLMDDLHRRWC